jgi:hypothetical protein
MSRDPLDYERPRYAWERKPEPPDNADLRIKTYFDRISVDKRADMVIYPLPIKLDGHPSIYKAYFQIRRFEAEGFEIIFNMKFLCFDHNGKRVASPKQSLPNIGIRRSDKEHNAYIMIPCSQNNAPLRNIRKSQGTLDVAFFIAEKVFKNNQWGSIMV